MSNIIQLKRGNSKPGTKLLPYEPGIDTSDNNRLYIGGALVNGTPSQAQDIKVGASAGLLLDENNYGTELPSSGMVEGQVYFQLLAD